MANGRQFVYYVACTLDGFIATTDGGVAFLDSVTPPAAAPDYGYADFFSTVGTVVMGRRTFEDALRLGGGTWPYEERTTVVFSTKLLGHPCPHTVPGAMFTSEDPCSVVRRLKAEPSRRGDIWFIGGSSLAGELLRGGALDRVIVTQLPVLLGDGIPLFGRGHGQVNLQPLSQRVFDNGVVTLSYSTNKPAACMEQPQQSDASA